MTLKEVGRRLGVTREWVRKIEIRAVRKLDDADAPTPARFDPASPPRLRPPASPPPISPPSRRSEPTPVGPPARYTGRAGVRRIMARPGRSDGSGCWIVAALACACDRAQSRFSAPPRFDGAGYAVLAGRSATGRGYREIDHPDAPARPLPARISARPGARSAGRRPVGWRRPMASRRCTVAATVAAWGWFRTLEPPRGRLPAGPGPGGELAWGRAAASIQSEPLFLLLGQLALLAAVADRPRRGGLVAAIGPRALAGRGRR